MEQESIHQPNAIDRARHRLERAVGNARGNHRGEEPGYVEPLLPVDAYGSLGDEIDRIGAEFARAIKDADALELRESRIRSARALSAIHGLAHRLAYVAWVRNDDEQLVDGLMLEAFANEGTDYRDTMLGLAPFHRQAAAMGLDAPAVFTRIADVCPLPEVGRTLRVFGERTDIETGGGWRTFDWRRVREADG